MNIPAWLFIYCHFFYLTPFGWRVFSILPIACLSLFLFKKAVKGAFWAEVSTKIKPDLGLQPHRKQTCWALLPEHRWAHPPQPWGETPWWKPELCWASTCRERWCSPLGSLMTLTGLDLPNLQRMRGIPKSKSSARTWSASFWQVHLWWRKSLPASANWRLSTVA